jgi:hypothetical protein
LIIIILKMNYLIILALTLLFVYAIKEDCVTDFYDMTNELYKVVSALELD